MAAWFCYVTSLFICLGSAVTENCGWRETYSLQSMNIEIKSPTKNPNLQIKDRILGNNVTCRTIIEFPSRYMWMRIHFSSLQLNGEDSCSEGSESVTISNLDAQNPGTLSFCGRRRPAFMTREKSIVIEYNSGMSGQGSGFSISLYSRHHSRICDSLRVYILSSGSPELIYSPNYPVNYEQDCKLKIDVTSEKITHVRSLEMDISPDCSGSNLELDEVYDSTSESTRYCAASQIDEFFTETFYLSFNSRPSVETHPGIVLEVTELSKESIVLRYQSVKTFTMSRSLTEQIFEISFYLRHFRDFRYELLIDSGDDDQVLELEWITKTIEGSFTYMKIEIEPTEQKIQFYSDENKLPFRVFSSQSRSVRISFYNNSTESVYPKNLLLAVRKHARDVLPLRLIALEEGSYLYVSPKMLTSLPKNPDKRDNVHIFSGSNQGQIFLQDVPFADAAVTSLSHNFNVYNGDDPSEYFDMTYTCMGHEFQSHIVSSVNTNNITLRIRPQTTSTTGRLLFYWTIVFYTRPSKKIFHLYPIEDVTVAHSTSVVEYLQSDNTHKRNAFCWLRVSFLAKWLKLKLNKEAAPGDVIQIRHGSTSTALGFGGVVLDDTDKVYANLTMEGDSQRWIYFNHFFNILYQTVGSRPKLSSTNDDGIFSFKTYYNGDQKDFDVTSENKYIELPLVHGEIQTWKTLNYPDFLRRNTKSKYIFSFSESKALGVEFRDLSHVQCDKGLITIESVSPMTREPTKIDVCRYMTNNTYKGSFPKSPVEITVKTGGLQFYRGFYFNTYPSFSGNHWFKKCNSTITLDDNGAPYTLIENISPSNIIGSFKCLYTFEIGYPYTVKVKAQEISISDPFPCRTNQIRVYAGKGVGYDNKLVTWNGYDSDNTFYSDPSSGMLVEVDVNCRTKNTLSFQLVLNAVVTEACDGIYSEEIRSGKSYSVSVPTYNHNSLTPTTCKWYFYKSIDTLNTGYDSLKYFIKISVSSIDIKSTEKKKCSKSSIQFFDGKFTSHSVSSEVCGKMSGKDFYVDADQILIVYKHEGTHEAHADFDHFYLEVSTELQSSSFPHSAYNSLMENNNGDDSKEQSSTAGTVIGSSVGTLVIVVVIVSVAACVARTRRLAQRRDRQMAGYARNTSANVERRNSNVFFVSPATRNNNSNNNNGGGNSSSAMSHPPYTGFSDLPPSYDSVASIPQPPPYSPDMPGGVLDNSRERYSSGSERQRSESNSSAYAQPQQEPIYSIASQIESLQPATPNAPEEENLPGMYSRPDDLESLPPEYEEIVGAAPWPYYTNHATSNPNEPNTHPVINRRKSSTFI